MERIYDAIVVQQIFNSFPEWLKNASQRFTEVWIQPNPTGDGTFVVDYPDLAEKSFKTVYEAYHEASNHRLAVLFDKELFLNGDVYTFAMEEGESTPEEAYQDHLVYTVHLKTADVQYAIFTKSFASWVYGIQEDFEYFAAIREKYLKNPESFEAAYNFVEEHPISWVRPAKDHAYTLWMPHNDNLLEPYFEAHDGTKAEFWVLETGEHVAETYDARYFDPNLSVWDATSPADAYIRVAAKIEDTFHMNGTRKDISSN